MIATPDLEVAEALQRVFQSGLFRVYINHDVIGCEMGGALKNVIAIAAGMAEGLSVGDNTRSAVIARGLAEVRAAAADGAAWASDVRCSPIGAGPRPDPSAVRRLPMPLSALGFARAARLWAAT